MGSKRIFIFDIFVHEQARGKGYGRTMLDWLSSKTVELGLDEIGLHVVGDNEVARRLYESAGYEITNLYLAKRVGARS